MRSPHEVLTRCLMQHMVEVPRGPAIVEVAHIPDPVIGGGMLLADRRGPIRRPVVRDDDLEVLVRLAANRRERLVERRGAVVHRQADGYVRAHPVLFRVPRVNIAAVLSYDSAPSWP